MQLSGGGFRARLVAAVFAAVAGAICLAGPAAGKPSGSGGGGPARIAPGAENPSGMAPEIYFVLIAVGVAVGCAVLAFKASGHLRRQRATSPQV